MMTCHEVVAYDACGCFVEFIEFMAAVDQLIHVPCSATLIFGWSIGHPRKLDTIESVSPCEIFFNRHPLSSRTRRHPVSSYDIRDMRYAMDAGCDRRRPSSLCGKLQANALVSLVSTMLRQLEGSDTVVLG